MRIVSITSELARLAREQREQETRSAGPAPFRTGRTFMVWAVYGTGPDGKESRLAEYPYNCRKDADEHASRIVRHHVGKGTARGLKLTGYVVAEKVNR